MKKIICILLLTCVIMGAAFAQAKPAAPAAAPAPKLESAIGLDLFQLLKGFIASDSDSKITFFIASASYEKLVAPHFSIGVDGDFYYIGTGGNGGNYFSLAAAGRYYPQAEEFEKFFLGTTVGFNRLAVEGVEAFFGLNISLKTGYKLKFKDNLFIEPSLAYVLSKADPFGFVPTPLGWNGGLRFGYMF